MVILIGENSFSGFIPFGGRKYAFEVLIPANSRELVTSLKVDWRLKRQLGNSLDKFLMERKFRDPNQFYQEFKNLVSSTLESNKTETWLQSPIKTSALLKNLQKEISSIKNYVKDFDIESGLVKIEVSDAQFRTHEAVLKLSQNYKVEPCTVVNHDLPLKKNDLLDHISFLDNIFSLTEFCEKFLELITVFQEFWNMTAIIDSQCCILDPVNPTLKDIYRRIKLSDTLSVVLTFNPFMCNQMPNIKLLGRQSDVAHYQNILQKNLESEMWDTEVDLMFNLSTVLEISIPNKIYMEESVDMDLADGGECAICFTLNLENMVPSEMCENLNCKSGYHSICLFKYLSSIPRNRDYFGKIQGECPNCENVIYCTVPKLL